MNETNQAAPVVLTEASLSEYDIIFALDRSGSMGNPSTRFPGETLWQEAKEFTQGLANFADTVDEDGLDLILFGSSAEVHNGVTGQAVAAFFDSETPRGTTNLGAALQIAVDLQKASNKNTICVVVTDGAPNDPQAPIDIINAASNSLDRDEQLTFLFVQMGRDRAAWDYLVHLDDNLTGKFDIVDSIKAEDAEELNPVQLLENAING